MPLISVGYPQLLTVNIVYSLPTRACHLFAQQVVGGAINFSNDGTNWMSTSIDLDLTPAHLTVGAAFIRAEGEDVLVTVKTF